MQTLFIFLLAGLVLLSISLQKTYSAVPIKEVKRRARSGDELAKLLYRAASYGPSLRFMLWLIIGFLSAWFFLVVSNSTSTLWAMLLSAGLIWVGFVYLPSTKVTGFGAKLAATLAPIFAWILNYLQPILDRIVRFIRRHQPLHIHTGLYEKDDFIELIEKQRVQSDNRIDQNLLEIAKNAISFNDRIVRDQLVPRRVVKAVSVEDTIGPVLMTELHSSGHSRFPVYEGKHDNIVGLLFLRDLVGAKSGGSVRKVMHPEVMYVHEEQSLYEVLQIVYKTRHHLFIVVNTFEEYVGIISLEDILEELMGKPILDEFDQHHDLRAVASKMAEKEHKEHEYLSDQAEKSIKENDTTEKKEEASS